MKKAALVLLVLPFFAFKCVKEKEWFEGKVIRISCASFVVQLTNDYQTGQDGWKNIPDNNKEYNDVINASNKCDIPAGIDAGKNIRFRIEAPKANNVCVICSMYDAPPTIAFELKDISVK